MLSVLQLCSNLTALTLSAGKFFDGSWSFDDHWDPEEDAAQIAAARAQEGITRGSVVLEKLVTLDIQLSCCIWGGMFQTLHTLKLPDLQNYRTSAGSHPWSDSQNDQGFAMSSAHWDCKLRYFEMDWAREVIANSASAQLREPWVPSLLHLDIFAELEELVLTNHSSKWSSDETGWDPEDLDSTSSSSDAQPSTPELLAAHRWN